MSLIEIVNKHDLKGLKENLKFSNINMCDCHKNSLLQLAIFNGDSEIANYLILNSIDINHINEDGNTPLHFSILYNRLGIFKHLIKSKVNINIVNHNLESPLMLAMRLGRSLMTRILLEANADTTLKNKFEESLPFYALYLDDDFFISSLQNINPLYYTNSTGDTLLHRAAYLGKKEIVRFLAKKYHLLVNKRNNQGETPLFCAVRRANRESIIELLKQHAILDITNIYDEKATDIASMKILDTILAYANSFDYKKYLDDYPLQVAVISNKLYDVKSLNKILRRNKKDMYGYIPLDYAKFYNYKTIINELSH